MNIRHTVFLLSTLAALAACDNKSGQASTASTNATRTFSAEAAPASVAAAHPVTLNSASGNVAVTIKQGGTFIDKSKDAAFLPEDTTIEQVLLLQRDDDNDLTVSAINNGKADGNPENVLVKLKSLIESDKSFSNIKVSTPNKDRLAYTFSHNDTDGSPVNESCVTAINTKAETITVCATSSTLEGSELESILSEGLTLKE